MSDLFKQRSGHYAAVTRLIREIDSLINTVPLDIDTIKAKINILHAQEAKITSFDKDIHASLEGDALVDDITATFEKLSLIQVSILKAEAKIKSNANNETVNTNNRNITMLPKLELPTFDGNPLDWPHFWDTFNSAVHNRSDMTGVQKFAYLSAQLKGEAAELLTGFALTNENYDEAITLAKETFGKPYRIIKAHLHALFDLPRPNPNSVDLRKFRSSYECHIRALKTLNTSIEEAGFVIAALLLRKLPPKIRDNINRAAKKNFWELNDFRSAMTDEIEHLQSANLDEDKYSNNNSYDSKHNSKSNNSHSTASTYVTAAKFNKPNKTYNVELRPNHKFESSKRAIKPKQQCKLCFDEHFTSDCNKFKYANDRINKAKDMKLCNKCLSANHILSNCQSKYNCFYCNGTHNSALCIKQFGNGSRLNVVSSGGSTAANATLTSNNDSSFSVALPLAAVPVWTGSDTIKVRSLFDQCAQRTFILKDLAENLSLPIIYKLELTVDGFTASGEPKMYDVIGFDVKLNNKFFKCEAIVVDRLPDRIKVPGLMDITKRLLEDGLELADPDVTSDNITDVGLLFGSDQYYNFVAGHFVHNKINLLKSPFGLMISGRLPNFSDKTFISTEVVTVLKIGIDNNKDDLALDDQLKKFWSLDSIGISDKDPSLEDRKVLESFENTISYENGQYVARLPWRPNHQQLPSNYYLAKGRLTSMLKRMQGDKTMLTHYDNVIKEQLAKGFVELVDAKFNTADHKVHYLAHHGVKKDSLTTPLRVVYDCSAKMGPGKVSLNDCLFTGPSLIHELLQVLLRFRIRKFACTSDIAKAFLMIGLHESDRDVTRFLWPEFPGNPNSKILVYRFCVVLFGATCSQFLLNATINYHLKKYGTQIASDIRKNIYVDNLQGTYDTESEIVSFYHDSKTLLGAAGLNLREWATNSPLLNEVITNNSDGLTKKSNDPQLNNSNILGQMWNHDSDQLSYPNKQIADPQCFPITKRVVLSSIAKIFDPLGFLLPVTICARTFMQTLWLKNLNWDEPLEESTLDLWSDLLLDLNMSLKLFFPRVVIDISENVNIHAFCDASLTAYGAVIYLTNKSQSSFLMAKARVVPLKHTTIPRLELIAALLGARLVKYVLDTFKDDFLPNSINMWSDSQVTLRWIESDKPLENFVRNRVNEINDLLPSAKWRYINSKDNPADLISRGISFTDLKTSVLWREGPAWLLNSDLWPVWEKLPNSDLTLENENKNKATICTENVIGTKNNNCLPNALEMIDFERFGSYKKLIKVIMLVFKFCYLFLNKSFTNLELIEIAEKWLIKNIQIKSYPNEYNFLHNTTGKSSNLVSQLKLFLHDEIIHSQGRIDYSELSWLAKNPILLPSNHVVTNLIITDLHLTNFHCGVSGLVAALRQKWWVPHSRQRAKRIVNACVICKKFQGKSYTVPPEAPLPWYRVTENRPFATTGIDYTGFLIVRNDNIESKVYIALFTCAISRAIHLEIVHDQSAESFLRAFRRFVARRSCPRLIISDNATTFHASADHLQQLQNHPEVSEWMTQHRCSWRFIPSRSPWFGGFWERLIGLTKTALKKTLGRASITTDELSTVIVEIECYLNDRPLTYSSSDSSDLEPLTPSHLLNGFRLSTLPTPVDDCSLTDDLYLDQPLLNRRQLRCANLITAFWDRWRSEYLLALRERQKSCRPAALTEPIVGDVVLIRDDCPRILWKLGRITKLHKGVDGYVRSVSLMTMNGIITRAIKLLYPLEINSSEEHHSGHPPPAVSAKSSKRSLPQRQAAIKAREAIQDME